MENTLISTSKITTKSELCDIKCHICGCVEKVSKYVFDSYQDNYMCQKCTISATYPVKYRNPTLPLSNNENACNKALASKKGLIITGDTGTGKTHLLYGVALSLKVKGDKFFNFSELLMFLKNQIINQNSYALLTRCCEDKFLFIDDLGSETTTQWVVEQFFYIINQRYNECLPIHITTNLGVKELETRYGVRLVSRLIEMCDFIKLNGKDYRRKKEGLC